jgi:hypothetical protein
VDGRGLKGFWEILTYNGNFSTPIPFIPLISKQPLIVVVVWWWWGWAVFKSVVWHLRTLEKK